MRFTTLIGTAVAALASIALLGPFASAALNAPGSSALAQAWTQATVQVPDQAAVHLKKLHSARYSKTKFCKDSAVWRPWRSKWSWQEFYDEISLLTGKLQQIDIVKYEPICEITAVLDYKRGETHVDYASITVKKRHRVPFVILVCLSARMQYDDPLRRRRYSFCITLRIWHRHFEHIASLSLSIADYITLAAFEFHQAAPVCQNRVNKLHKLLVPVQQDAADG
ncbi:hypothetical protein THASP1DRAFT_25109 [Thamnocephalis sphaerospora]|uniref:Uncharacterized protein n=1 Tax=Thamnocephalis sphaerospora TaxID=78915 RepID=A0A4P9XL79_9FUNG|nr:hypothetical protein THASP1DRAFT_25109 [Thamnocephalis sphaerospora]|eukprot:RKP06608.1 hypothetical protein THASP1DRAFT_25109 [Thamnocephalis sphaerospora]